MAIQSEKQRDVTVAYIIKRNGAYLTELTYPGSSDCVPGELFDANSSLVGAKRQVREDLPDNVSSPFRWGRLGSREVWHLKASWTEEWEDDQYGPTAGAPTKTRIVT